MSEENPDAKLLLELGDIIIIHSPSNSDLNNKTLFIQYLDSNLIELIDINSEEIDDGKYRLGITDGNLNDESIETIELISRAEEKGYARQNGLIPPKWVSITFGGDIPTIINGKITALEEDMVELSVHPSNEKIYIDFAYQGIPKHLPIESIKELTSPIRQDTDDKPTEQEILLHESEQSPKETEKAQVEFLDGPPAGTQDESPDGTPYEEDEDEEQYQMQNTLLEENKKELFKAGDVIFGEKLETITEHAVVKDSERRFGIEHQTNDLLNDLLSSIPTRKRTKRVLETIQMMINRFKQLREKYSKLSSDGEFEIPDRKTANYKPLVHSLNKLSQKLYWILPIVKNKKKIYDYKTVKKDDTAESDIIFENDNPEDMKCETFARTFQTASDLYEQYTKNVAVDEQNKYAFLYNSLAPLTVPYEEPDKETNIVIEKEVTTNLNTVVNNYDGFISTTFCDGTVKQEPYIMSRSITGLKQISSINTLLYQNNTTLSELTKDDKIHLLGFLTLPEPVFRYSQINLPTTSIYRKAELNLIPFLYSELLHSAKQPNSIAIKEDEILTNKREERKNYLKTIDSYTFDAETKLADRDSQTYDNFLNIMIPKTRVVFNQIKRYIKNNTNYIRILEYLQPFLIYPDDISFKQYQEIISFIDNGIREFKKQFSQKKSEYNDYDRFNYGTHIGFKLNSLIRLIDFSKHDSFKLGGHTYKIKKAYQLNKAPTDAEAIRRILIVDNGMAFFNALSYEDIDLFISKNVEQILRGEPYNSSPTPLDKPEPPNANIAKHYADYNKLLYDNSEYLEGRAVYYDEKFNKGPGGESLKDITPRKVNTGDFAFYIDPYKHFPKYYVRDSNNRWVHMPKYDNQTLEEMKFNNIKPAENKQDDGGRKEMKIRVENIEQPIVDEVLQHFDNELELSRQEIVNVRTEQLSGSIGSIIRSVKNSKLNDKRFDVRRYVLGESVYEQHIIISPYAELRDLILAETNIVKKQSVIKLFVDFATRQANLDQNENPNWFYCNKSGRKLLPTFYKTLADAFETGTYLDALDKVCAERGTKSDDGDKIVDKHSGYIIRMLDFDDAEGYDESGYKIVSRAVIEEDTGDTIMNEDINIKLSSQHSTDNIIRKIIITLNTQFEISLPTSEIDYIIQNTEKDLEKARKSKEQYKKEIKGKKNPVPYSKYCNKAMLMLTIAYYIVTVQTTIPSVSTNKTFPGCGPRSFSGYPLTDNDNFSMIKYVACTIRLLYNRNIKPWSALKRPSREDKQKQIAGYFDSIKRSIRKYVTVNSTIKKRIELKRAFLAENPEGITVEQSVFDARNWATFLPPLNPFKIEGSKSLDTEKFYNSLKRSLQSGSSKQFALLSLLLGKCTTFSLLIQESISNVISKKTLLLNNAQGDLLVENACCNRGINSTTDYFIKANEKIKSYNKRVKKYYKLYHDVISQVKPTMLFDPHDTKLKYPHVPVKFSEQLIYNAFIQFCSYNSGLILPENLANICGENRSAFKKIDSLEAKIDIMKGEGKNYTERDFLHLLNIINRENITKMSLTREPVMQHILLSQLINKDSTKTRLQGTHLSHFMSSMDSILKFGGLLKTQRVKQSKVMIELELFLKDYTATNIRKLIKFINIGDNNKLVKFINTIDSWKLRGENIYMSKEDETAVEIYNFISTYIDNITHTYPAIIMNKINYKQTKIPAHWKSGSQKFSRGHIKDIITIISQEHVGLRRFYDNKNLQQILSTLKTNNVMILINRIIKTLPFYSNIRLKTDQSRVETIFNGEMIRKIMKYLLTTTLVEYINVFEHHIIGELSESVEYDMGGGEEKSGLSDPDKLSKTHELTQEQSQQLEQEISEGKKESFKTSLKELLIEYIKLMYKHKNAANISNDEINKDVLKSKEKEKAQITRKLGDLTQEERQVQDIMKNQRLGEWSLGQTKALFVYDEHQYEWERQELEKTALDELQLNSMDGVTERTRDVIRMDFVEQKMIHSRVQQELMDQMRRFRGDDDNGDEENFDY